MHTVGKCSGAGRMAAVLVAALLWAGGTEAAVPVVVIDAGHGGPVSGVVGPGGLREKDLCLDLARRLKSKIDQRLGWRTYLTRDGDTDVPLEIRAAEADGRGGSLFVSIHAGGYPDPSRQGYAVFVGVSRAPVEEAAGGLEPWDAQQERHLQESRRLGRAIHRALAAALPDQRDLGLSALPLFPLPGLDMPAVVVEPVVLTSPVQEELLRDPAFREKIAEALYFGVRDFLVVPPAGEVP